MQKFSLENLTELLENCVEPPLPGGPARLFPHRRKEDMNWKLSKIVRNREFKVENINIFDLEWNKEGETELKDVAHAMRRPFDICTVTVNEKPFRFAVCEIAQNVFCFYLPE